jgi:hypothetical protein
MRIVSRSEPGGTRPQMGPESGFQSSLKKRGETAQVLGHSEGLQSDARFAGAIAQASARLPTINHRLCRTHYKLFIRHIYEKKGR